MAKLVLTRFIGEWLPQVESDMQAVLENGEAAVRAHYGMMNYHLGWANAGFEPEQAPAGKRLRPIFCLLACAEVGGVVAQALPAAAAIELLHNFSLIHDDIEDGDEMRRHRPTVWKLWGVPQAVNAGDAMFALAFAAIQGLDDRSVPPPATLAALRLFTRTALALTEGQHLDIGFETRSDVTPDAYLRMIEGKTAALVAASTAIGAIVGGAAEDQVEALWRFGQSVGLAFQIQDDILGIWGDPEVTGKAAGNDVLKRKKSLPMVHALSHPEVGGRFGQLVDAEGFDAGGLGAALALLDEAGSRDMAEAQVRRHHDRAVLSLQAALGADAADSALLALAESLLHRTS